MTPDELCADAPILAYAAGEVLLREGQSTGKLFILVEGAVEVVKDNFQINVVADRGAMFGEMSALLDTPHTATVRTLTECKLRLIEGGAAFLREHQELAFFLAQLLAQRLQGVNAYLVDVKRQFADQQNHLGIVDEVLESLLQEQRRSFTPGSDREPEY
ncbi:MAG: cyclic nucleotide-binding domain-containing protein [Hyphomonadaceae bacterium]